MDSETRLSHGVAFDRAAGVYAAARPGYPREAAAWLTGGPPQRVLDVGAGTGAFTASLVALGHDVVVAEPSAAMLDQLCVAVPDAQQVRAVAEALPFAVGAFDVVTVAGAFHWMEAERSVPELARVLRPGGRLGLVYNTREETTAWAAALTTLLRSVQPPALAGDWGAGSVSELDGSPLFGARAYREFRWAQQLDRERLVGLVASRSYVINLDDVRRAEVLATTADLFDHYAAGSPVLDLPYRTQAWTTPKL